MPNNDRDLLADDGELMSSLMKQEFPVFDMSYIPKGDVVHV